MKDKLNNLFSVLTRSELWVTVGVILASLHGSDLCQAGSLSETAQIVCHWMGIGLAVLTALGYTVSRTIKKIATSK